MPDMRSLPLACLSILAAALLTAPGCGGDEADTSTQGTSTGPGGPGTTTGSGGAGAGMTTGGGGAGGQGGGGQGGSGGAGGSAGPSTVAECFADDYVNPQVGGPDYDQFGPTVGSHCFGTNHQDVAQIERVVFLGDSITVGTPPTLSGDFYRSLVADGLAARFGLDAPNLLWQSADPFNGTAVLQESGDFASCSKWGARTDDLLMGGQQIADCFPADTLDQRTLVIMTMGGNDIASLTQDAIDGADQAALMASTEQFVQYQREAMDWLFAPGRFPNGIFVIFANNYEFTDGTGDVQSCDVSGLAGFDEPVPAPDQLKDMIVWANEQYMDIAVSHGADMIFLLEDFCGHGFNADDPTAPCYRGPGNANWFDLTCIHPNPTGHQHIADMFLAVVDE